MKFYVLLFIPFLLTNCMSLPLPRYIEQAQARANAPINVSGEGIDLEWLGNRIWQNECAGSVPGLVSWNAGEDFPSLGIGHFIWYPAGYKGPFDESFPTFVNYARAHGVSVPAIFNGPAPWPNKAAFLADRSGRADAMRRWLAAHVQLQTKYIILRSRAALPNMMQASRVPQAVQARYNALAATTQGLYCLVDYVNFKGEGIKPTERYKGQGWGLLQVLEEMRGYPQGRAATAEFSRAASAVLRRRVANSPAARGEKRWLAGWLNRCKTYQ
ncbi:MAG: hypothetical protein IKZ13_01230 [Akkermansia sp.]|nr:hypothetical protein [Akkermansia sp.]